MKCTLGAIVWFLLSCGSAGLAVLEAVAAHYIAASMLAVSTFTFMLLGVLTILYGHINK